MRWPKARWLIAPVVLAVGACVALFPRHDEYYFLRAFKPTERLVKGRRFSFVGGGFVATELGNSTWRVFDFRCSPADVRKAMLAHPEALHGDLFEDRRPWIDGAQEASFSEAPTPVKSGGITCQLVLWPEQDDRAWYIRAWDGIKTRFHL